MADVAQAARKRVVRRQGNRRALLLEAAARQFLHQGYAAASMRDIAADAGMQPGSIYYHFPSKAELLVAVHEEGMRRITEAVAQALEKPGGPWARLEAACVAHLTVLLEGGDFFQAVMREMPAKSDPGRRRVTRMRDRYEEIFADLLDALPLPRGVDRHDLRLMLLGAMNWSYRWYRPGAESPAKIARKFLGFLRNRLDTGT
ncbi:MAG: TetR/AcrR family transcriptional regulator [Alphaproteobacteria bacterium]|nr:TetR/AcrR family transcriptional regulator [Alphaproteobacteria bacterium]